MNGAAEIKEMAVGTPNGDKPAEPSGDTNLSPEKNEPETPENSHLTPEKHEQETSAGSGTPFEKDDTSTPDDLEKGPVDKDMAPITRIATSDYPKAFQLALIIVALILSIFLVALDMTIVATAIPSITDEFDSLDQVGWYGSAFFLTVAAFQSTWGKGYKFFPLKTTFLISIGLFEVGSLICAVAQNSTTLIIGRAIAGNALPFNVNSGRAND